MYDGRAVIGKSFEEHLSGTPVEILVKQYSSALKNGDNSRSIVWA
jgi:nitronate monooxygenase